MSPARIILPASQFSGDWKQRRSEFVMLVNQMNMLHTSELGSASKLCIALHADCRDHAGDHSFFKMSKHISPVSKLTFGWKHFVTNRAAGGVSGYSTGTSSRTIKSLPSKGVDGGPLTIAILIETYVVCWILEWVQRKISMYYHCRILSLLAHSAIWSSCPAALCCSSLRSLLKEVVVIFRVTFHTAPRFNTER